MLSTLSLWSIGYYQTRISPNKGFGCPYRLTHGGTGCSGYAKQRIQEVGLLRAIPDIRARFAACRTAADERNGGRTRRRGSDRSCETAICGLEAGDCALDSCGIFRAFRVAAPRTGGSRCDDCGDCGPGDCSPGGCDGGCDVGCG